MMADPVLKVDQLSVSLTQKDKLFVLINDISFSIYKGQTVAIVGESGSGKSVIAKSILRLLPRPPFHDASGRIMYKGENLLTLHEKLIRPIRGSRISMIFQNPQSTFNPVYTIEKQLLEVVYTHTNQAAVQAKQTIKSALWDANIDPDRCLKSYPHELSGGMLQRVSIASALLCNPDILIADEPTTALDASMQCKILELLKEIQRKRGMAILIITHDIGVVRELSDYVVVLYAGEIVEQASKSELFNNPSHPYTQALLNSQPYLSKDSKFAVLNGSVPHFINYPNGCRFHPRCPKVMNMCCEYATKTSQINDGHIVRCHLYGK